MALFRPIIAPTDLPAVGTARENGTFDFKGDVDVADQRELAKDVAGFANALGGVILVGVYESKGSLGRYAPMNRDHAEAVKVAYELAVAQRCQPQPVVDAVRIETDDPLPPGHVVAVNVYPAPLGPVGVRWDVDKKGPSFAFPLRTTAQTHFMSPTELAMLMVPEIRRVAILLDSIPLDQRDEVFLFHQVASSGAFQRFSLRLVGVDSSLTTVTFELDQGGRSPRAGAVPIDSVGSVWKRDETHWNISVRGSLNQELQFVPHGK